MQLVQLQSYLQSKVLKSLRVTANSKTLENVQFVKLFKNAEEVIEKLEDKSKHLERIAVVGGGYIGVELAEAFERLGKRSVL